MVLHSEIEHRTPADILAELELIETEIQAGLQDLRGIVP